jgi:hypothetical protein
MPGVSFAAMSGLSLGRLRTGRRWRGPCRSMLRCALALGLALAVVAGSAAAERAGLQREIRETQEVADDIARAIRRVQVENLKLERTLRKEVGKLTAEDVTLTALRLSRLDADTARLHETTLDNRITQRKAELRLLEADINRRAADLHGAPAAAPDTLSAQAELEQLRTLRAVNVNLMEGFQELRSAESERLALAGERLALLRSRAELHAIHEHGGFDQDPRVVAIRATISRLARDAVRLDNQAGGTGPRSIADPAQRRLLQLEADDAIIRSSVRVGDLELIRLAKSARLLPGPGRRRLDPCINPPTGPAGARQPTSEPRRPAPSAERRPPHAGGPTRARACSGCRLRGRRGIASKSGAGSGPTPRLSTGRRHVPAATPS